MGESTLWDSVGEPRGGPEGMLTSRRVYQEGTTPGRTARDDTVPDTTTGRDELCHP
jgi:hypothetical protein